MYIAYGGNSLTSVYSQKHTLIMFPIETLDLSVLDVYMYSYL